MYVIGRGRRAGETYPEASQTAALAALSNRYLIGSTAGVPDPFTVTNPTFHIAAAVNVTRRASGIFMVAVQMPVELAAPDKQVWSAVALFGSTCSGGVANGAWLLDIAALITNTLPTGASPMGEYIAESSAGNLGQSMTVVGVNAVPVPPGASTIIVPGTTVAGTQITPGAFFGVVYELP